MYLLETSAMVHSTHQLICICEVGPWTPFPSPACSGKPFPAMLQEACLPAQASRGGKRGDTWLDETIPKVFSNLNDSPILYQSLIFH